MGDLTHILLEILKYIFESIGITWLGKHPMILSIIGIIFLFLLTLGGFLFLCGFIYSAIKNKK